MTRDQTLIRKIKEIYLALELEGNLTKEEIFELYVNRIFLETGRMELKPQLTHILIKNLKI